MAFGAGLAPAKSFYKKASTATTNFVCGFDFNRSVYEQYNKEPYEYRNEDFDCDESFGSDEEWTAVTKSGPRKVRRFPLPTLPLSANVSQQARAEECAVQPVTLQQFGFKLSKHAVNTASQAAGVSLEYAQAALKYATLETAQGIGQLTNSDTAANVVKKVRARFPLLQDIKRAYQEGRHVQKARRLSKASRHSAHDELPSYVGGAVQRADNMETPWKTLESAAFNEETGAELEVVYEESTNTLKGKARRSARKDYESVHSSENNRKRDDEQDMFEDVDLAGHFAGTGSLQDSGPIIGDSKDSDELNAAEEALLREEADVDLRLKRAVEKPF